MTTASTHTHEAMRRLLRDLYPICRSITGEGVRQTLAILEKSIPLECREVPSGTKVLDWAVPDEWNIEDAYIALDGERVIDFQRSNLHLVSYSTPTRQTMRLAELKPHLHSLPEHPAWIPYRTSYYRRDWGFCLPHEQLEQLPEARYEVAIDGRLEPGSLSYGELFIPGENSEEVLFSTHVCHPSMANDNLSGIALLAFLAQELLKHSKLRYSYRFLFVPGTIGAITWLALNELNLARIRHGLVVTGVGDAGTLHYKPTRHGDCTIDRVARYALRVSGQPYTVLPWEPYGYDERQYTSPGFDLPVGRLSRTPYGQYPEYHTSADDLSFITTGAIEGALEACLELIEVLEHDRRYINLAPKGEPQLGRRGLYGSGASHGFERAMLWLMALSDGQHSLLDIAERSGLPFGHLAEAKALLEQHDLLAVGSKVHWEGGSVEQSFAHSKMLQEKAHRLIPGGAHTYAKGDDEYPVLAPGFITHGQGCRIWDVDGNEFIEYGMGLRAVTLGHAYPTVVEAAYRQMKLGSNFTRPAEIEVIAAERLLELIPGEMVKFAKNGSDVTTAAVKLARAYTGRSLIAICRDQPFFSTDDWFIGTTEMDAGIPEEIKALTVSFAYNDLESVRALFAQHPRQIACLVLEAAHGSDPAPGFLEGLRKLCTANGTLLVFDEMITGFRWHLGGAQSYYGVTPDLSTFGKGMANGFAVSALTGKREIMELGGLYHPHERVFLLSTTHGAETPALAAALATMDIYQQEDVIGHLWRQGERLKRGFGKLARTYGLENFVGTAGLPCNLVYFTRDAEGSPSQGFRTLFLQELIRRGVLAPSLVVSYSHTPEVIDQTLEAISGALEVYRQALDHGLEGYLVGRPVQPVFRRYNGAV